MSVRIGLLIALLAIGGCARQAIKPPEVVRVAVPVPVPVDAALTERCPIAMPGNKTVAEAVRVARERRAALEACNAQLKEIRETH